MIAASLVHTNDVLGELEPCGCRTNPQGGLSREANLLEKLGEGPYLRLDGGDLLFQSLDLPEVLRKQAEVQAEHLLRTLALRETLLIVPGEKDFALGVGTFDRLTKKTRGKVRFLAANLLKGGKVWLPANAVVELKKVRVGVFGIAGTAAQYPSPLSVAPADAAARAQVAELKNAKVDLIVMLSHQGLAEDQALLKRIPGIDAVVGGHSQSFLQEPLRVNGAWIFQSSFRNQYVGIIPLGQLLALKKSKEEDWPKAGTEGSYRMIGLDPRYDSPEGQATDVDRSVAEFKKAIAAMNSKREQETLALGQARGKKGALHFQTFPKCAECHLKQFDFWRQTRHAQALGTLTTKGSALNKECLGCHSVGLGESNGWSIPAKVARVADADWGVEQLSPFLDRIHDAKDLRQSVELVKGASVVLHQVVSRVERAWAPVQCENCHGAGGEHPFSDRGPSKAVSTDRCVVCHTPERAPGWYPGGKFSAEIAQAKLKSMSCPAGTFEP